MTIIFMIANAYDDANDNMAILGWCQQGNIGVMMTEQYSDGDNRAILGWWLYQWQSAGASEIGNIRTKYNKSLHAYRTQSQYCYHFLILAFAIIGIEQRRPNPVYKQLTWLQRMKGNCSQPEETRNVINRKLDPPTINKDYFLRKTGWRLSNQHRTPTWVQLHKHWSTGDC